MTSIGIFIFIACFVGAAFFSGIETGVIACHRIRLRALAETGARQMAILEFFLTHPDRLFGTTLVGTNICIITLSVLAARFSDHLLGNWGEGAADVIMTVIILIF